MKQLSIWVFLVLFGSSNASAQVNPHAIGIRGLFGNIGSGGEISYQHGFSNMNRLELDLGWRSNRYGWWYNKKYNSYRRRVGITGVYHWVWNLEEGFNWFAGVGGQVDYYSGYDAGYRYDGFSVAVGGQIGIEYDFNTIGAPLQLGLDARPMWNFVYDNDSFGYGLALSLRYTF